MENIKDWSYRCEGNAGIVISDRKRVLRLVKLPNEEISKKNCELTSASLKNVVMNQLSFAENVIKPLMIKNYIVPMKLVQFASDFAEDVAIKVQSHRPAHRLAKGIPSQLAAAIEMPDLCFLPGSSETLSIEIKPKWGYLPASDDMFEVKKHVCRYCMQQAEKVLSGKYRERSFYCPIDLFSGCRDRMSFAVAGLMRNPQNNCRVFKDGSIILSEFDFENFDQEVESWMRNCFPHKTWKSTEEIMGHLIKMVVECLLMSPDDDPSTHHRPQRCQESKFNHVCSSECSRLRSNSVLSCVLDCQRLDEDLSLKRMLQIHSNVTAHFEANIGSREQCRVDGPFTHDWFSSCCESEVMEDILDIKKFLVARSVKDCSIIISLASGGKKTHITPSPRCRGDSDPDGWLLLGEDRDGGDDSEGRNLGTGGGGVVAARVTIIDIDVKKFDKITFYYEEDVNIVDTYLSRPIKT